jgi:hypothetical protein
VLHKPTNEVGSDTLITCMENKHGNGIYGHGQLCAHVSKDPCPSMEVTVQNSAHVRVGLNMMGTVDHMG